MMKIDNGPERAIATGKWSRERGKELYCSIANEDNRDELGREGFLIFPDDAFKLWPRASGLSRCKYPHHQVRDGELVVSVPGLRAAYSRAKQQKVYSGELKAHLDRHFVELGLAHRDGDEIVMEDAQLITENTIDRNFGEIEAFVEKKQAESTMEPKDIDELCRIVKTPEELMRWMTINFDYDDRITEDDDGKGYRLLSPDSLIAKGKGVCWDFTELERVWFRKNYPGKFKIFYVAGSGEDACPSHTFLVRYTPTSAIWFEFSWVTHRGEHVYRDEQAALSDIVRKFKLSHPEADRFELRGPLATPKEGLDIQGYMDWADTQPKVELDGLKLTKLTEADYAPVFGLTNEEHQVKCRALEPEPKSYRESSEAKAYVDSIDSPEALLSWMTANFQYGYVDGRTGSKAPSFNERDFMEHYVLQGPDELLRSKVGNCFDQVEFERFWFTSKGITHGIYYIEDAMDDCHTFLVYDLDGKSYWFEAAWKANVGIHEFPDHSSAITEVKSLFERVSNPTKTNAGAVIVKLDVAPRFGITYGDYIDWVRLQTRVTTEGNHSSPKLLKEAGDPGETETNEPIENDKVSRPKQVDAAEAPKNGVKRKELYIAFIEYAKRINPKNTFGSVFDKDAFRVTYPFVPEEMRYFYRLANPLLCILDDEVLFSLADLRKVNTDNPKPDRWLIFAADRSTDPKSQDVYAFNREDKGIYHLDETAIANDETIGQPVGESKIGRIAESFDRYIEHLAGVRVL